ncbi:Methyl-CPG-binding domain protein 13, putative isoform 2 [Hibiscus syriacus]|uniref:Methyl-CPG-binding domain protein 13, putative isoform 2 n=1 Tax=Hibiscus syriacus TaxID=106335 RepID=A0A6A3ALG2_HIBSY|nr:Methyl-CPG-binding domain protein 13, putative isoform 2 [Hibiscus syriacus]
MKERTADDWLPPGWKVELKRRRNGKKDKCYRAPCGELRFNSRAEVTRYLEKCNSKTEEKEKVSGKKPSKKVTVEKAEAEGLPPGWTKEVRITKRARRVRRDPFYIDPVSGYWFRSMKDALRYVETGEIRKLAIKPKEKGSNNEDLVEDNICVNEPGNVESQKVTVNGTIDEVERQTTEHVSNSSGITKEEEMLTSASTGEQTSLSKHTPDQRKAGEGAELSSLNLSEAKGSKQIGQKDSEEGMHASGNAVGILSDKQLRDDARDRSEKSQLGKGKTKIKKDVNVPRRASKRLAAVALDPTSELKTTKACRTSINQSSVVPDGAENSSPGNCIDGASKQLNQPESSLETNCALDASKSKEQIQATSNVLSSGDALTEYILKSLKVMKRLVMCRDPILACLLQIYDRPMHCIAIQTLTGITCDTTKMSESNCGKVPGIQTTPEARSEREENGNRIDGRQGCGIDVPPTGPTIWKEQSGKVEKCHKTDKMAGPSLETPLADMWADPCIEFAIKTLTGAIPVEYDVDNQHGLQQQPINTPHQSGNHLTLPDIGIDKFSQTNFICQQYDFANKSMSKDQGIRSPIYNYAHHHRTGERP